MKFFFSLIFVWQFLFVERTHCAEVTELFLPSKGDEKASSVKILKINGISVSQNCADQQEICFAALNKLVTSESSKPSFDIDPASKFCEDNQGETIILSDKDANKYTYCYLNSDYYFDAWALYLKKENELTEVKKPNAPSEATSTEKTVPKRKSVQ